MNLMHYNITRLLPHVPINKFYLEHNGHDGINKQITTIYFLILFIKNFLYTLYTLCTITYEIKVLDSTCGKFATVDCNISNRL